MMGRKENHFANHRKKPEAKISQEVLCAEYEALYHYALSLCKNKTEAEDLTQETFLKAMKGSDRFEGSSSLYTWLCAILKNLWFNRCKKQARELPSDDILELQPENLAPIEERIVQKETAMELHKILHDLAEPYKEVFSLRTFGELPFADIAELFGKTESWARVTYYRARKMIGERMEQGDTNA